MNLNICPKTVRSEIAPVAPVGPVAPVEPAQTSTLSGALINAGSACALWINKDSKASPDKFHSSQASLDRFVNVK